MRQVGPTGTRSLAPVLAGVGFAVVSFASLTLPTFRAESGKLAAGATLPIALAVAGLLGAILWRHSRETALWSFLAVAGWGASLQLIDAPSGAAYQHLARDFTSPARIAALALIALQVGALVVAGRMHVRATWDWVRRFPRFALAVAIIALLAPAAVPSRDAPFYLLETVVASVLQLVSLVTLVAAVRSLPGIASRAEAIVTCWLGDEITAGPHRLDGWVVRVAIVAVVLSAFLSWASYQWHPHVPDEVVYLLHARYLAAGMWTMPLPPVPAGFNIDLMYYDSTRWFSPVPPGWPMVLAIGVRVGVPWLVNPILGGIAVCLTYLVLGRLMSQRETRLATILLAVSPWFLFMSMSLMTHPVTLVTALAAALGVAIARERSAWYPALLGGFALGATSIVRPLEGLLSAAVLGVWSLGARGRRFRLAPSVALVIGAVVVGSAVRSYNALLTGSPGEFPIMAYMDKHYQPGANDMGFGPHRGVGFGGLDPFPGHGVPDIVVNTALNTSVINTELLGWPVGGVTLLLAGLALGSRGRRLDWVLVGVIAVVAGGHAFYWFSGGPDFGARYWYLVIVPCVALVARALGRFDDHLGVGAPVFRSSALVLSALALCVYVPWRAVGKYYHYRGMRPDVRVLAREHDFGRSLVLVRGSRHPDFASAATYNPIDLKADAPIYAWDASPEIRAALLRAYSDRTVWILDGPSLTGGAYRIAAGPLSPREALETSIPPDAAGSDAVYDPVTPPRTVR